MHDPDHMKQFRHDRAKPADSGVDRWKKQKTIVSLTSLSVWENNLLAARSIVHYRLLAEN